MNRRQLLQLVAALPLMGTAGSLGWLKPARASTNLMDIKSLDEMKTALGIQAMTESKDIAITAPDIAENGAVVPIAGSTQLPGVEKLIFVVTSNPSPISASFDVNPHVDANFTTRVKMGKTSDVYVIALMNDKSAQFVKKEVKVTLGGCGG